ESSGRGVGEERLAPHRRSADQLDDGAGQFWRAEIGKGTVAGGAKALGALQAAEARRGDFGDGLVVVGHVDADVMEAFAMIAEVIGEDRWTIERLHQLELL